jgi:3-oxoacyl-ACP reductase-like protein
MVGGKMPGRFNITSIKVHLSKTWGLGPSRSDGVLLLGTAMEPAKQLGSEVDAKAWLDRVVTAYAQWSLCMLSGPAFLSQLEGLVVVVAQAGDRVQQSTARSSLNSKPSRSSQLSMSNYTKQMIM